MKKFSSMNHNSPNYFGNAPNYKVAHYLHDNAYKEDVIKVMDAVIAVAYPTVNFSIMNEDEIDEIFIKTVGKDSLLSARSSVDFHSVYSEFWNFIAAAVILKGTIVVKKILDNFYKELWEIDDWEWINDPTS